MPDLRAGERADEITEVWIELKSELVEVLDEWRDEHAIPFGFVERTETAQERTRLVVERMGAEAMPTIRQALGW